MKTLLTIILLMLANTSWAESGFYYDVTRSGEGISVAETADGGIAWVLFTFIDGKISVPPIVSPPPPTEVIAQCANSTLWLTGQSLVLADGFAIGEVYLNVPPDYPFATANAVSAPLVVGTFLMEVDGDGFDLIIESNHSLPNLSVFDHTFTFINPLAR